MIAALALVAALHAPPPNPWLGADKVKHFLMSAFVQSVVYSAARGAKLDRGVAQGVGGASVGLVSVWKEMRDRRAGRVFSAADLAWDAAGGLSAAALLNGTR